MTKKSLIVRVALLCILAALVIVVETVSVRAKSSSCYYGTVKQITGECIARQCTACTYPDNCAPENGCCIFCP